MADEVVLFCACPECGAGSQAGTLRCWLCGRSLADVQPARGPTTGHSLATWGAAATLVVFVITLALVTIGVWQEAPGLAVVLILVVLVPLAITILAWARERSRGGTYSLGAALARFFVSLAVLIGGLVVLSIAAFAAFFVWCLSQLSMH